MKLKKYMLILCMVWIVWMLPLFAKAENRIISRGPLSLDGQIQKFYLEEATDQKHHIHIGTHGQLKIVFQAMSAGNYVRIFSQETAGDVLYQEKRLMNGSEAEPEKYTIYMDLGPGEYYLLYSNFSSSGEYRIKATFNPAISKETEPNDDEDTAMPIVFGEEITGFLPSHIGIWNHSANADNADFYSFEVTKNQQIMIIYGPKSTKSVLDISITKNHTIYWRSEMYNMYGQGIGEVQLSPGTYNVEIWKAGAVVARDAGEYTFKVIPSPNIGAVYTDPDTGLTYKITDSTETTFTAAVKKMTDKTAVSVEIPDTIKLGRKTGTIVAIGNKAFAGCDNLRNIEIGENITKIGKQAFRGCSALTRITGMQSIEKIDEKAFTKCTSLKQIGDVKNQVTLPKVRSIGIEAFAGCTAIRTLNISSPYLKYLNFQAFIGCTRLKNVSIESKRLYLIGTKAFYGCTKLKKVVMKSVKLRIIGTQMFDKTSGKCMVRVPKQLLKRYRTHLANEIRAKNIKVRSIKQ